MLENRVNVCCDTYHPGFSDNLVDSLISYIDSKLDYERKTPEFVSEVRRRLYFIHEYNCQVATQSCMYLRSKKIDQLLVKYVELEFEVLYFNNGIPPKQVEIITELRVLRLLQVMLYKTVLNNESQINENADAILKKTVLKLLGQVKSTYLAENKLVHNVINKLLKNVNSVNGEFNFATFEPQDIHRNLATSDYGTDDDSDFENDTFNPVRYSNGRTHQEKSRFQLTSDCMEVPLMVNGIKPIPTIEFVDDDDDNYMVYLQKRSPIKRNFTTLSDKYRKKSINGESSKTFKNSDNSINNCKTNLPKETNNAFSKTSNSTYNSLEFNDEATCIVVCSDSDEETVTSPSIDQNILSKKKETVKNEKNKNVNEKQQTKSQGVVTFELIDDDDDDESGSNYMVYLQKEVETNKKSQKHKKPLTSAADNTKEIIISDSEDEEVVEIHEENCAANQSTATENNKNISEKDTQGKGINFENASQLNKKVVCEDEVFNDFSNADKIDDILKFVDPKVVDDVNTNNEVAQIETPKQVSSEQFFNVVERSVEESVTYSAISEENMNIITFEHEIELNAYENSTTNFLIDPAIIFENMSSAESPETEKFNSKSDVHGEIDDSTVPATPFDELGSDKLNTLGGPVLSERMDDLDDVENLLECRLNDSLLEEILLNDSYLLESHKEFEDLECFLFDDKKEQGFDGDMTKFPIESEDILQSDFMSKDSKNLESLLMDSQTLLEQDDQWQFEIKKNVKNCKFKRRRRRKRILKVRDYKKNRIRNISKCNPLKDFTNNNNNNHQHEENTLNEYCDLRLEKEQRYHRRRRENTFKATCRRKINAVNKR